ncbi:hypothetical protein BN946_scf184836.g14 [Trametes cinnabarina]|uniref:F-box domain-containing protein n=1 Tax=Pycnoporus cinnabarinus TaxID=5643 RepID=A0A060S6G0_PYCCI|nr:hypothetical protein BN946_scf184836.g14 [Trametes cinnabarina]
MKKIQDVDLPVLEELRVNYYSVPDTIVGSPEPRGRMVKLDAARLPALRVLCLISAYIPWDSPLFSQLRVLHLEAITLSEQEVISLDTFLELLAESAHLQCLDLSHAFFVSYPDVGSNAPQSLDAAPGIYQLLLHLRVDPGTTVEIATEHDEQTTRRVSKRGIRRLIPQHPAILPILDSATSLHLPPAPPNSVHFSAASESDGYGTLTVSYVRTCDLHEHVRLSSAPYEYITDQQLVDICDTFADSSLRHLTMESEIFGEAALIAAFCDLPDLSTLEVSFLD